MLSGEIKTRSGLRESPVIKEGDEGNGRSAYNEQFCKEENDLARILAINLENQPVSQFLHNEHQTLAEHCNYQSIKSHVNNFFSPSLQTSRFEHIHRKFALEGIQYQRYCRM